MQTQEDNYKQAELIQDQPDALVPASVSSGNAVLVAACLRNRRRVNWDLASPI
jgi:hypothetical protein